MSRLLWRARLRDDFWLPGYTSLSPISLFLPSSFVSVSCCRVSVCLRSFFPCGCQMMCEKLLPVLSLWLCGVKHPLAFVTSDHPLLSEFRDRACYGNLYGSSRLFFSLVGMAAERLDSIHHFVISNHLFNVSCMMGLVKCTEHIYWYYTMLVPSAAMNKSSSSEAYGRRQHFFSVVIFVSLSSDSNSFWWNKELDTSLNSWRR